MNTTLKVFIILTMIMAIVFAGFQMASYAYRENWKRRWNEDSKALADDLLLTSHKLADESAAKVKSQNLAAKLDGELSESQSTVKTQAATISDREKEIQNQQLQVAKLQADVSARDEKIATLSGTLERTRTRNAELQHIASVARGVAHQLNLKLAEVEDDLHNTSSALDKARQDLSETTKELNDNKARLALVRERHPAVYREVYDEAASHEFVQGVVAAVNLNPQGQQDLVMLTIGREESVEVGMEFIVFRANQYVVKVRAEKVLNDMVACRVIPETWNAGGIKIQVNDLAQNRF